MADEKNVVAATNLLMSAVERLIDEEGFQPEPVISALGRRGLPCARLDIPGSERANSPQCREGARWHDLRR
jgi:hypothetical protein